jgi:hypothetical protein
MPQRITLQPPKNLEPLAPEEMPMLASPQDSSFSDANAASHDTGHAQTSYMPYTVAEYKNPHGPTFIIYDMQEYDLWQPVCLFAGSKQENLNLMNVI